MSRWAYHWCRTCQGVTVEHRGDECVKCEGERHRFGLWAGFAIVMLALVIRGLVWMVWR